MFTLSLTVFVIALALLGVTLWNALAWPRLAPDAREGGDEGAREGGDGQDAGAVSILIPARDEELNIAGCLDAALAQGAAVCEVLVYDDHSTDRTAAIVSEYAQREVRVRVVAPAGLPPGWCGKNFACARLAAEARAPWLLFIDADARLLPRAAGRMKREAEARGATLLSCWPALDARGFWERALMPMLNFVVFTLYPAPLSFRRPDASLGLAHGACLMTRRDVYETVGGHSSVRDQLFEDVRLAQHWRARGHTSLCFDGRGAVRVRMYCSLAEIWRGFQKNFYPAFRSAKSFWLFLALHLCVMLLPFAILTAVPLAFVAPGARGLVASWGLGFAAAAAACVLVMRAALAVRFGQAWWTVALHPLGEAVLVALGLSSWWRCRSGRGVVWKGRRYRTAAGT